MTITHHLGTETLMSFAAGSLPSALAAVAGAHLAMCGRCRDELVWFERIGGALLDELPPLPLTMAAPGLPGNVLEAPQQTERPGGNAANPILRLAEKDFAGVTWRRIGIGLWHHRLPLRGTGTLQLIKAGPGASVPEHGHGGAELTLILRGALSDATGSYGEGDVADLDQEIAHTPVADRQQGCVCAIANEVPTRFHGWLARLLQPWHGL
jgi:putative transcriptional regulator